MDGSTLGKLEEVEENRLRRAFGEEGSNAYGRDCKMSGRPHLGMPA
jgi:hypothetical protein